MTWFRKMRPVLIVLGLAGAIVSAVGARALTHGDDAPAKAAEPAPAPRPAGGLSVIGYVDTNPPPVKYGLPSVLPSGMVAKVSVKDGDEVKAGDPLYDFDATVQTCEVAVARAAVEYARTKVSEAEEGARQHAKVIEVTETGVEAAKAKEGLYASYYRLVANKLDDYYKTERYPPETWQERKDKDPDLYKANVEYVNAMSERKLKEADLRRLKAIDLKVKVKEAEEAVKQAQAQQAKAQSVLDLCVVRARTAGTVEQVTIGPGTTLGVGTREPALWLIPAGPRVVRAEVEAEFAHRVGPTLEGKTVTISDHTDAKLTYSGTVRRVGGTFLLKRNTADNFLGGDTRVLEVVVEVGDANPPGKPPLRVGQRVRVNLGQ